MWRHGEGDSPYNERYERGILRAMLPGVPPCGLILRVRLSERLPCHPAKEGPIQTTWQALRQPFQKCKFLEDSRLRSRPRLLMMKSFPRRRTKRVIWPIFA